LGGLGANIGSDDWEKAKRKKEAIQEYAKQLRMVNTAKPPTQKRREEETREKTAREKALEFAKNVPKPRRRVEREEDNLNENE
jgi:Jhy protein